MEVFLTWGPFFFILTYYDVISFIIKFWATVFEIASCVKKHKREGKGGIEHHPSLELSEMQKLYAYLNTDNNIKSQQKNKVRENIFDLKITDFLATRNSEGKFYIYMKTDEVTKNHRIDTNTAECRMYARD
ncbi:hypothetical protein KUTeg_000522, partial [Tegillarca granosa]